MTLEEIKESINGISLSRKLINDFGYGENYLASEKESFYPKACLEIPYNIDLALTGSQQKTLQFALLIILNPSNDDIINDVSKTPHSAAILAKRNLWR